MKKTYCDICKVEIPDPEHSIYPSGGSWTLTGFTYSLKGNQPNAYYGRGRDLCSDCGFKVKKFYDSLLSGE